jgi:hypothetical protein
MDIPVSVLEMINTAATTMSLFTTTTPLLRL